MRQRLLAASSGDGGASAAERWFAEGLRRDTDPLAAHRYLARIYEELFHDSFRARRHYHAYVQLGGNRSDLPTRAGTVCVGDSDPTR